MIRIAGLVRTSTVDYPGLIAAVIFTPGCNFNCFYCHNRALISPDAPAIDRSEVMGFLNKRSGLIDGLVVSGGEPLLQPDLLVFLAAVRQLGYRIKLDTNGSRPLQLKRLLRSGLVDRVAIDYKAPWDRYPEICGCRPVDAAAVRSSIELLDQSGQAWEARTTVVPQLSEEDLAVMARSVPPLPAWSLQLYRRPDHYLPEDRFRIETPGHTPSDLERLAAGLQAWQPEARVRC